MVAGSGARATKPRARLVGLDGLRGSLSLCVILVHVTAHFSPTILGITHLYVLGQAIVVFFVMSGFLIFYPFARALLDDRDPLVGLGRYMKARLFRVFPAYLVIFVLANALGLLYVENAMVVQQRGSSGGIGSITEPSALLLHLSVQQNYLPQQLQTGISSSWTLTVELAFYMLLPFSIALYYALIRRSPRLHSRNRYLLASVPGALLVLGGLAWRIVAAILASNSGIEREMAEWGPNGVAVLSRSFLPWSDNFGWGMLATVLYLALLRGDLAPTMVKKFRTRAWAWAIIGFLASSALYFLAPRFIAVPFAVLSVAFLMLIVLPTDGETKVWRFATFLDNRLFHWIGLVSLSLYLIHFPVLLLLERLGITMGDTWGGWVWNFLLVTVVSVALASISYTLIEKPALAWATRRRTQEAR